MDAEKGRSGAKEGSSLPRGRLDGLSDGVFSIAATLLVLEIALPLGAEEDMLGAVLGAWPSYLAYVISFLTIGWVWIGHAAISSHIHRVDSLYARLNLLLLLVVAFLPFPTKVMAEFLGQRDPEQIAVPFYGLTLLVISLLLSALWRYAVSARELLSSDLSDAEMAGLTAKTTQSLPLFAAGIVLGLFLPTVGAALYLLISIYLVVPVRHLTQRVTEPLRRTD